MRRCMRWMRQAFSGLHLSSSHIQIFVHAASPLLYPLYTLRLRLVRSCQPNAVRFPVSPFPSLHVFHVDSHPYHHLRFCSHIRATLYS